jgi:fumarate reductase subunit C
MIMAYVRPVSKYTWYLQRRSYSVHMLQELTSLFIGIYALLLLWGISAVAGGPEAYRTFLNGLTNPGMRLLLWVLTVVIFYHAIAWFSVTPKAMVVQKGEEFVPGGLIAGAHYVIWVVLTLVVLFLAGVF